jgi:hypothetical protein
LGNLSSLSIDLINPLLNSYSISGGTTAGDESSSYDSSYSTTESSSESSEPVTKKTVPVTKKPVEEPEKAPVKPAEKPVVQLPVKQKVVENVGVLKKGFVMPDHEPTDEELAELEAKLKMVRRLEAVVRLFCVLLSLFLCFLVCSAMLFSDPLEC